MPRRGLEPPRLAALVPETSASTNSAIWASGGIIATSRCLAKCNGGEGAERESGSCDVRFAVRPRAWKFAASSPWCAPRLAGCAGGFLGTQYAAAFCRDRIACPCGDGVCVAGACNNTAACNKLACGWSEHKWTGNKKADSRSAFLQNWCPEEDSNLHASQR